MQFRTKLVNARHAAHLHAMDLVKVQRPRYGTRQLQTDASRPLHPRIICSASTFDLQENSIDVLLL